MLRRLLSLPRVPNTSVTATLGGSIPSDFSRHASVLADPNPEHLPSASRPPALGVNNTFLRRHAVLAAMHTLRRLRPRDGCVLFLSKGLCLKYGPNVPLSEASALRFVAEHTSIPVPKVHCAFSHKGKTYILMDRIDGQDLAKVWGSRSPEAKNKILSQLKQIVSELRSIPAPGPQVSNVDGGPLCDYRFPGTSLAVGPFESIGEFHRFLRDGIESHPNNDPEINTLIDLQDKPWPMPVFTHGDLSSFNVLVRGDDVAGIVDWETSGWYPSYWEHSMAWNVSPRNPFWKEEVGKFLDTTPEEMEMERIRLTYFGDV